ncbi:MAG: hypothetical protein OXC62_01430 [Aestuariivita sp.]|nr:hypothetical protein [Aestuariivita sp.]
MKDESAILLRIYELHAELAERAALAREGLNKIYSGIVAAIIAGSVLFYRIVRIDEILWVLPTLGILISLSWMVSLHSATGRLSAKHKVLLDLETKLPFEFLKRENEEFKKLFVIRRKWTALLMPLSFLSLSCAWLIVLKN